MIWPNCHVLFIWVVLPHQDAGWTLAISTDLHLQKFSYNAPYDGPVKAKRYLRS
jgi:hypothetical protein